MRKLKEITPGDLLLVGSTRLARTRLTQGVVDRVHLIVDPVILGAGSRLFAHDLPEPVRLSLAEDIATPTGAQLLTYKVNEDRED